MKCLFGGVITNNVVSLDCPHVSRTKEEFYTVRCQVADMRNLHVRIVTIIKRVISWISSTMLNLSWRICNLVILFQESLDEVTVKDMLEGDNMYTCSKCQKKVRAEKRACFKKLPDILCFNTMRYTFNMVTMNERKGQHTFLVSPAARHVTLHGEKPNKEGQVTRLVYHYQSMISSFGINK